MHRLTSLVLTVILAAGLAAWSRLAPASDDTHEPVATGLGEITHRMPLPPVRLWEPGPNWDNGYYIYHEMETTIGGDPSVELYDAEGEKVREARIWFPDSTLVNLERPAVTKDGNIVAIGYNEKSPGTVSGFIARTDLNGKIDSVITTDPYLPQRVCTAKDGTVWVLGQKSPSTEARHEDYSMLRNYSFTQGLVHEYLPRDNFLRSFSFSWSTRMVCTGISVVLYSSITQDFV